VFHVNPYEVNQIAQCVSNCRIVKRYPNADAASTCIDLLAKYRSVSQLELHPNEFDDSEAMMQRQLASAINRFSLKTRP